MANENDPQKPVSLPASELHGIVPHPKQPNGFFFNVLSKDQGTYIAPRGQTVDPCTITVTVQNDEVKVHVDIKPNTSIEDRRIVQFIEQRIKEGFAAYHNDKRKNSIDI